MSKSDFIRIDYKRAPIKSDDNAASCIIKTLGNATNCHRHYAGKYSKGECLVKEMAIAKLEVEGVSTDEIVENADYIAEILGNDE